MRRFEFVGGGSEKFWESERTGTSVTVRFGRIGTNGQTQVKDLGSDAAAEAHVTKLVAEKVKKGYVENGAGSSTVVAPPAAPDVTDADEDTWTVPAAWWRHTHPFKGRGPQRSTAVDPAARSTVRKVWSSAASEFTRILDGRGSDTGLVKQARLFGAPTGPFRSVGPEIPPLGAAVAGILLAATYCGHEPDRLGAIVDDWVASYGIVYAAEAGALMASVQVHDSNARARSRWVIGRRSPNDFNLHIIEPMLRRLRALIAAADDDAYAEIVVRFGQLRDGLVPQRLVSSYLLPTEQQWVGEDIASAQSFVGYNSLALLLSSVTTASQATALIDLTGVWAAAYSTGVIHSMAAHVGPPVAPLLAAVFDSEVDADHRKRALAMLAQLPTDEAFDLLLARLDRKFVQPAVLEAMGRFPRRAMRLLAAAAAGPVGATAAKALLRDHAVSHPDLVERVRPMLSAAAADALDRVVPSTTAVPVAAPDQLPALLVAPPWVGVRKTTTKPVVVECVAPKTSTTLVWRPGEQQEWANTDPGEHWLEPRALTVAGVARAVRQQDYELLAILARAPVDVVRQHLRGLTPHHAYEGAPTLRRILGRLGDDAADLVLVVASARPSAMAAALLPLEGSDVAGRMAEWFVRSKSLRPVALKWLDRHPAAAARELIPAAVGEPGNERSAAEAALRLLDQRGHRDTIRAAAEAHGPAVAEAVAAFLALDPLQVLPAKLPTLPAWLDARHLPQVLLRGGHSALPLPAVEHLCTVLAISKPGESYAGVDIVRAAVDPASLAEFGWALFERWRGADFPAKESWILHGLGLIGDDETVRRLAPLIRAWPGEAGHARAVAGLGVLSGIGSEVALMHLHGIAENVKFAALKAQAKVQLADVADGLGLTPDQLADRLVPDFDLDPDGTLLLDFGPRRFRVGFDEQLKPTVADEDGARRKVLPKPGASDDPVLAPAAYARFSHLKKDVKTVATDQLRRFERAMVTSRRWTATEQRRLFVEHPLLWHLARRLVWAVYDEQGRPLASFRIAEDRTLADSADDEFALDADTAVGIAHPLHLGADLGTWSDLFADYEILQPFEQLGREVHKFTDSDEATRAFERFERLKVPTGKILGLYHRGWERGSPEEGGVIDVTYKPVPGGQSVVIDLEPGIIAGMAMEWPEQTIVSVSITDVERGHAVFGTLDPVTVSEVLRDLTSLRS